MCIEVLKKYVQSNAKTVTGFKTLIPRETEIVTSNQKAAIKISKWNKSALKYNEFYDYQLGFHIFVDKETATLWGKTEDKGTILVAVKGRNLRAVGTQFNGKVYVCEELFISARDLREGILAGTVSKVV